MIDKGYMMGGRSKGTHVFGVSHLVWYSSRCFSMRLIEKRWRDSCRRVGRRRRWAVLVLALQVCRWAALSSKRPG